MSLLQAVVENLAERLAAAQSGRVSAVQLLPHLPISLGLIESRLKDMVENQVVFREKRDGVVGYEFPELLDTPPQPLQPGLCVYSGERFEAMDGELIHPDVLERVQRELDPLAGTNAWPANAVWQHELVFITGTALGPIRIAEVSGRSRMPLKQVKQRLMELAKRGACAAVETSSGYTYHFPPVHYPPELFRRNDAMIRQHPASLKDEAETRLIRALIALIVIVLACFALAFIARIPFPLILLIGALSGALAVWRIWTRRTKIEPKPI